MKTAAFMSAQVILLLLLGACSETVSITPAPAIDPEQQILFYNGVVLTMDPEALEVTALAVEGEKIGVVGSDEEILALEGPGAMLVDLQGATLMPGFVDAHSHLFNDSEQYFDMSLPELQQLALENGITSLGNLFVDKGFLREMQKYDDEGGLQIRTSLYLVATDNCGRSKGDWWIEYPATNKPGEMLRTGGIKIFTDGGTCERPALSYELRPGEGLGDLFHNQEELDELVGQVHDAGRQVAIHAIGDRAVEQAQNAIASALDGQPNTPRHRIDHNSVVRPELLSRYGEIGIVPVLFGLYPICEPFGPPPPEQYRSWEWPTRALLDSNPGLPVAWHGDDPYSGRVRPLDDLYSLLTRDGVGSDGVICPAPAWHSQHAITGEEALSMMTIHAAYALFRDDEVGSLEPGKFADLIVLSNNPLAVAPVEIPGMAVWMTMVGGRTAHCTAGQEAVCPQD
jgi:predicted amidohydrolase YtcJ